MTEVSLLDFGAKIGEYDCSPAFKKAFEKLQQAGGGKLNIPAGFWRTGPLDLPCDIEMHLQKDCHLSFIPDPKLYRPVWTRWEGVECYAMHPLILSTDTSNVAITGEHPCYILGNGDWWWNRRNFLKRTGENRPQEPYERELAGLNPDYLNQPGGGGGRETQFLRPSLIEFFKCKNVTIQGVSLIESPFWTIHPTFCSGVTIKDTHIMNPSIAPNTDGIDVDSCSDVLIQGCTVEVGDDGICLKSGSGADGISRGVPTQNVMVKDCTVKSAHGGIVIGSETAAGINNVTAQDCHFLNTDRGIRIKSRRGRGGDIFNITLKNLEMKENLCPIAINMYYRCGVTDENSPLFSLEKQPITQETPDIHSVTISGINATNCKASAGFIAGLPERPIEKLSISDCKITLDESPAALNVSPMDSDMFFGLPFTKEKSFRVINAPGAKFSGVDIKGVDNAFIYK